MNTIAVMARKRADILSYVKKLAYQLYLDTSNIVALLSFIAEHRSLKARVT